MKILLLGGSGFAGRHVDEKLTASGHNVTSVSRATGCDLTDEHSLVGLLKRIEPQIVVNCAAHVGSVSYVSREAAKVLDSNARMLLNLYRSVQQVAPEVVIINPIANCAYPGESEVYTEATFWDGPLHSSVQSFGFTRRLMIVLSDCYYRQFGVRSINFFTPNMYGPLDDTDPDKAHALDALVSKVVKLKKLGHGELEVWGTGVAIREWLFVEDFARIIERAVARLDDPVLKVPVNIGQNHGVTVKELVETIIEETEYEGPVVWQRDKPDGAPKKVMDSERFRQVFPDFKFTDIRAGIRRTIECYESRYPY